MTVFRHALSWLFACLFLGGFICVIIGVVIFLDPNEKDVKSDYLTAKIITGIGSVLCCCCACMNSRIDSFQDSKIETALNINAKAAEENIGHINDVESAEQSIWNPIVSEALICVVCLNGTKTWMFSPCNHLCLCDACKIGFEKRISEKCVICREKFTEIKRVFV